MLALLMACGSGEGPAAEKAPEAKKAPIAKVEPAKKEAKPQATPEEMNAEVQKTFEKLFEENSGFIKPEDDLFGGSPKPTDKKKH